MPLLDAITPQNAGLLGVASGLLAGSGPSTTPVTLGQSLGQGLQGGLLAAQRAQQLGQQDALQKAQIQNMGLQGLLLASTLAQKERMLKVLEQYRGGAGGAVPGGATMPGTTPGSISGASVPAGGVLGGPGNPTGLPLSLVSDLAFANGDLPSVLKAYELGVPKPTRVNAGGYTVDQFGHITQYPAIPAGSMLADANNPRSGVVPVPGAQGVMTGNTEAVGRGNQPFSMKTMAVPVRLANGDQLTVTLNPVQAEAYTRTGQLPPEIARAIPGMQVPAQATQMQAPNRDIALSALSAATGPMRVDVGPYDASKQVAFPAAPGAAPAPVAPAPGVSQTQGEQITQRRQEAGGKALDEQAAKDFYAFNTGGAQDAMKGLAQLNDVVGALNSPNPNLSGPVIGSMPDMVLKFTNPKAIAMRERVEEVVQRTLRAILGAQFTENEGTRLIARAYNPNLSESENAIRVQRLLTQFGQAYQAKQSASQYYAQHGTLEGWQGKLPSISDFNPEGASASPRVIDFNSLGK